MKNKRGLHINIHFTNRWLYSLIAIGMLIIVAIGVYAWANPTTGVGHELDEVNLPSCSSGEALGWDGSNWGCISTGGISCNTNTCTTYPTGSLFSCVWECPDGSFVTGGGMNTVNGYSFPEGNGWRCVSSQFGVTCSVRCCS